AEESEDRRLLPGTVLCDGARGSRASQKQGLSRAADGTRSHRLAGPGLGRRERASTTMIFKPYYYFETGCAAYLFGCGGLGKCAVVDAHEEDVASKSRDEFVEALSDVPPKP